VIGVKRNKAKNLAFAVSDGSTFFGDAQAIEPLVGGSKARVNRLPTQAAVAIKMLPGHLAQLGFEETWRGSGNNSKELSWVNMRVPDGTDYVEFMLYKEEPDARRRGTMNHVS